MTNKIDYTKVLNPAQLEAVISLDGPILVIAGAGSGKTRTLVYRVARLVESGVPPESILLLTFTRKAAQEMLDRASSLADPRCTFVSGGTFHSLAFKVLRSHADALGYANSFTILDRSDMEEVLRSLIPELQMPKKAQRFPKRGTLANILSKAANLQEPVEAFILEEYGQFLEVAPEIGHLGRLYADYKKTNQLMDYDDLIISLQRLLGENKEIRAELSRKYSHIMVDEYQDTNAIQADIVKGLAHDHRNVMVVGDDSQSIYSFRGANYRNMFDFPSFFPEAKIIKLEQNYRSTQPILSLTNALMDQADEKYTKCLFTERGGGEKPKVIDTRTEHEQALLISNYLKQQMAEGQSIDDFAVLFRAAYHSFELEAELTRQKIPYVKYGGFKFLESAHIKDFLAHMRVVVNRDEAISWIRILRLVRNVGMGKSQAIIKWMKNDQIPLQKLAEWPGARKKDSGLKNLGTLLGHLTSKEIEPKDAVEQVMEYYLPILKDKFDDYPRRQKELEQLAPMANRYRKLRGFLDDLVLEPPASYADIDQEERGKTLTLSTVHSAKGLEWPVVFIIWAMEGRFPASMAYSNPLDLEEERRLMYVAATRAKDHLLITYPGHESVPVWSNYGGAGNGLSSFISALPGDLFSHEKGRYQAFPRGRKTGKRQFTTSLEPKSKSSPFSQGDRVRHPAFGPGVVSRLVSGNKMEVLFKNFGKKLLHLEYTTLEK
ncbi:MAG: UvrD-helicase domain-containing protein, partial [Deltaproteobacteria bacterium]|nr:UvrD-helicase domain-containing protein [Deltaproteobacteria bacterium]